MKLCPICKTKKDINDFYKCASTKDGRNYICRVCLSERSKANRARRPKKKGVRDFEDARRMKIYENYNSWIEMGEAAGIGAVPFSLWAKRKGLPRKYKRYERIYSEEMKFLEYMLLKMSDRFGKLTEEQIFDTMSNIHISNKPLPLDREGDTNEIYSSDNH